MTIPALIDDRHDLGAPLHGRRMDDSGTWVHLRDYLEIKIQAVEHRLTATKDATDRALSLARELVNTQVATAREAADTKTAEIDRHLENTDRRLMALETTSANLQGRIWMVGAGLGILLALVQVGLHFWSVK